MDNNLTQEELAKQLGVSFQAVARWENVVTYPDIWKSLVALFVAMFLLYIVIALLSKIRIK